MAMLRGEATCVTDAGETLYLVADLLAFAEAEEVTGLDPQSLMKALTPTLDAKGNVVKTPTLKNLGGMLYGMLKEKRPGITHADAIRLLGAGDDVGVAIGKALEGCMPKADPSAGGKAQTPGGIGMRPKRTGQRSV